MPGARVEKPKGQQNFDLTPSGLEWFEAFCSGNNYNKRGVFLAGVVALMDMTHEQRVALFKRAEAIEADGFQPATTAGESGDTPSVGSASADERRSKPRRRAV